MRNHGSGPPARATTVPIAPAASSTSTTPRRSRSGDRGDAEKDVLPGAGEGAGERDRRAEDRADRGRAGAGEEGARRRVAAQALEAAAAEEDEGERGQEGDESGEQAAGDSVGAVADRGDRRHHRPRRHLAERDRVEEFGVGHPVVGVDGVALHQRDDHEAAAEGEAADLEGGPGEVADAAGGDGGEGRRQVELGERTRRDGAPRP